MNELNRFEKREDILIELVAINGISEAPVKMGAILMEYTFMRNERVEKWKNGKKLLRFGCWFSQGTQVL